MEFYMGTHMPSWLTKVDVPLFVSHTRLAGRRSLPRALGPWALDSGAFGEIATHGRFITSASGYVTAVRRYRDEIGGLRWASQQDHMTEAPVLARSSLASTVAEAQDWTVRNLVDLRTLDAGLPIIPVLQGQTVDDYRRCIDLFIRAGVDLTAEPLVGLGSVCRRQATPEIERIARALTTEGVHLHGFGVKTLGLDRYAHLLDSADSLAWSFRGRNIYPCPHTGATTCANCLPHALEWRTNAMRPRFEQLVMC